MWNCLWIFFLLWPVVTRNVQDAAHQRALLRSTEVFRPPHSTILDLEIQFYDYWRAKWPITSISYLPIFWSHFFGSKVRQNVTRRLQSFFNQHPFSMERTYFTVAESMHLLLTDSWFSLPQNVLVFSSKPGDGHIAVAQVSKPYCL